MLITYNGYWAHAHGGVSWSNSKGKSAAKKASSCATPVNNLYERKLVSGDLNKKNARKRTVFIVNQYLDFTNEIHLTSWQGPLLYGSYLRLLKWIQ